MAANNDISNYYPADIMLEENKNRHIQILVKKMKSIGGGVDKLLETIQAKGNDIKEIYSSLKNIDAPTSKDDQKKVGDRVKLLTNTETIYGVALPLPNELRDSQTHQWENTEGFLATKLKGLPLADTLLKGVGELASTMGARKPGIDPGYFQDYTGTAPRTFEFSWDLVPNNIDEAENILKILYNLKKFTLPTSTISGISMLSPYLFDIIIGNEHINSIINMNNVVCTQLSINYSADGSLQFLPDGIPKWIQLSMSFAERATVMANFY